MDSSEVRRTPHLVGVELVWTSELVAIFLLIHAVVETVSCLEAKLFVEVVVERVACSKEFGVCIAH